MIYRKVDDIAIDDIVKIDGVAKTVNVFVIMDIEILDGELSVNTKGESHIYKARKITLKHYKDFWKIILKPDDYIEVTPESWYFEGENPNK